jgi:hypothetical protein
MNGKAVCLQNSVLLVRRGAPSRTVSKTIPYYSLQLSGLWGNGQPLGQTSILRSGYYVEPIEIALRRLGKHRRLRIFPSRLCCF